jgi:hypothetical protein
MGNPPDALLYLIEARDITEFGTANSDCVPSRKVSGASKAPDYSFRIGGRRLTVRAVAVL